MLADVAVETLLLILKIAFLVLLYLFIWRIVRTAAKDVRLPQESFILAPGRGAGVLGTQQQALGKLIVQESPTLDHGLDFELDSAQVTIGRGGQNDLRLTGDDFASALHARFEPRRDGVYVEDIGSTNGTFVNGARLERPRKLAPGDRIRIGATDLRFDA